MLAASAVLFTLWVIQQRRNVNPLVDVRALVKRAVLIPHLAALLVGFAFFGNTLITTQLLQGMKGAGCRVRPVDHRGSALPDSGEYRDGAVLTGCGAYHRPLRFTDRDVDRCRVPRRRVRDSRRCR